MGILNDMYHVVNQTDGLHEYVGAAYTVHMYDILKSAQTDKNATDLFASYDASLFGLDKYPALSDASRKEVNDVIIQHFLMHEIGTETEYLFRMLMNAKMCSIMPKYNAMLDVLEHMKENRDAFATHTSDTAHDETRENSATSKNRFSDTPQQSLDHIAVETETGWIDKYLTSATINDDKNNGKINSKTTVKNRDMSYGRLMDELSTKKFNIYGMICDELNDLFLGLYA